MTKTMLAATLVAGTSALALPFGVAHAMPDGFADLAAEVTPAVVNISTVHHVAAAEAPPVPFDVPEGSLFGEFFKRYFHGQGQPGRPGDEARALGSGFVVDPAGYVVTNNHVIDGADAITVTLEDGTELPATLVGADPATDLAVLKVETDHPLTAVAWGDSGAVRVGDWVLAVGNPFGLGGTVTAGILSARGRDLGNGPLDDYLQIDAPINQGNSGGPTFDGNGKVIGINSAIYSPSGGSVGIGFAIPSELAQTVVADLIDDGHVERGWLGVQIQEVTPEIAEGLGLDETRGALVASIMPDSPAVAAGVQVGDVIVTYDGQPVATMRDLPRLVATTTAGQKVRIGVVRDGKERTLDAVIAERDTGQQVAVNESAAQPAEQGRLGLALAQVNDETRRRFGLGDEATGVLVTGVDPAGPAAERGLRPGDLIVQVAQHEVTSPDQVVKLVDQAVAEKRASVLMLVERNGDAHFVAVPVVKA
ncbi:MAG: DegQ family serine endoprotease [Alphaproteobacteria bacterium]